MISLVIEVTDQQFWTASTEAFLHDVTYSLNLDYTTLVIAGSSMNSGRRHLMGSVTGTIDIAWLAPGANNATLLANQEKFVNYFTSIKGKAGSVTVLAISDSYISSPLCDLSGPDPQCVCPENGVSMPVGVASNCTALVSSAPPQPADDDIDGIFIAVVVIVSVAGAIAILCVAYVYYTRLNTEHTYPWLRRRLLSRRKLAL